MKSWNNEFTSMVRHISLRATQVLLARLAHPSVCQHKNICTTLTWNYFGTLCAKHSTFVIDLHWFIQQMFVILLAIQTLIAVQMEVLIVLAMPDIMEMDKQEEQGAQVW